MQKPASTLSLVNSSILQCIKEGYLLWLSIVPHIAKSTRYTLGVRIENTFLDVLEKTYTAYFTRKETKSEKVAECIRTLDTEVSHLRSVGRKVYRKQTIRGYRAQTGGSRKKIRSVEKELGKPRKEKSRRIDAKKRNDFRRRNTNGLSEFHLFVDFALLALSFSSSVSRLTLNTFGSPSRSVCMPCHLYCQKLS